MGPRLKAVVRYEIGKMIGGWIKLQWVHGSWPWCDIPHSCPLWVVLALQ